MPLPLKGAAEGGDGGKFHAGQVDIRFQADGLSLGPAVQRAVLGQPHQILHRAERDRIRALRRQSRRAQKGERQNSSPGEA